MEISKIVIIVLITGMLSLALTDSIIGISESYGVDENISSNVSMFNNTRTREHLTTMTSALNNTNPTGVAPVDALVTGSSILIGFISMLMEIPNTVVNMLWTLAEVLPIPTYVTWTIIALLLVVFIFGIISALTKYKL